MYRILDGQLAVVRAKAVMFATGGYGRVYNTTSNDYASTGDGLAMTAIAAARGYGVCPVPSHWLISGGVLDFEAVRGEVLI